MATQRINAVLSARDAVAVCVAFVGFIQAENTEQGRHLAGGLTVIDKADYSSTHLTFVLYC